MWRTVPILIVACAAGPTPAADPAPSRERIDALVRQLGDPRFSAREEASRELAKLPDAAPAVRAATRSDDPEVARRAADLLREYARLASARTMERVGNTVRDRKPDLFVEHAVRFGSDSDPFWQLGLDFGWAGRDHVVKTFGYFKEVRVDRPPRELQGLKAEPSLRILPPAKSLVTEGNYLFRGNALTIGLDARVPLLIARGPIVTEVIGGFFFVNGDVTVRGPHCGVGRSVIYCDGNCELKPDPDGMPDVLLHSLVVANGNVRLPQSHVRDSVILATGDVVVPQSLRIVNSTIRAGGKIHLPQRYTAEGSNLEQIIAEPTAPFKFFELSRVGIEVAAADGGGVRIEKLDPKSPFAVAGLQKGDVVLTADGQKVESVAGFRKQVRATFAQGDGTFGIRRGEETRDLTVRFPD